MDLVLGTAQLGLKNYGINNQENLSDEKVQNILRFAKTNNINFLDTSDLYGDALDKIQVIADDFFKLILKLNFKPILKNDEKIKYVEQMMKNTDYDSILFHNHNELIANPNLWNSLLKRKKEFKINKIGVSLYNFSELKKLNENNIFPDSIEIPYNIIDTEFNPHLKKIKENGTEIIVRSVFMQGLLFMNPQDVPEKLKDYQEVLQQLVKLTQKHNVSLTKLMLDYVKKNSYIDKLVIGIDSIKQLEENIVVFKSEINESLLKDFDQLEIKLNRKLKKVNNWKNL
ncbi:aldo/keto reductase [bacterium]|nr:aldo/keto reductase [bacterium]